MRPIEKATIGKEKQRAYLQDYIDVLGRLAEWNGHDLRWWVTYLASKERFASPLPIILSAFFRCVNAIADLPSSGTFLVVVRPPWPVVDTLKRTAERRRWKIEILAFPLQRVLFSLWGQTKSMGIFFRGVISSIVRIGRTRRSFEPKRTPKSKDIYLIKSFVYESSFMQGEGYRDPFFGDLAGFLQERLDSSVNVVTVVVGFKNMAECYRKLRELDQDIVPLEYYLRYRDIIASLWELVRSTVFDPFRVKGEVPFLGYDISGLLRAVCVSGGWYFSFFHYLHYMAAKRISKTHCVRACAVTFEGIPWERPFIEGIRGENPNAFIIGYQHSVVPQSAAGVFLSKVELERGSCPNKILTTGKIPADLIRKNGRFSGGKVQAACALRYNYLHNIHPLNLRRKQNDRKILVALEGVREVVPFVDYVLQQATEHSDLIFRFRCHPILPMNQVLAGSEWISKLPDNVEISKSRSVFDDVREADFVLYWGTTVALEALMIGKPVIHFDLGEVLSFDPIFELEYFKWTVTADQQIGPVIDKITALSDQEYKELKEKAQSYIKEYFFPVNENTMAPFLDLGE